MQYSLIGAVALLGERPTTRNIVGTLLSIGQGEQPVNWVSHLLQVQEPVAYGGSGFNYAQAVQVTRRIARGDTSIAHLIGYHYAQTRIASLRMIKEASMRTFPTVNVDEAFHPLSHHGEDPDKQEKLARVQTYQIERFARFAKRMTSVKEGDGNMLDNSIILYGSNLGNSDLHNCSQLPEQSSVSTWKISPAATVRTGSLKRLCSMVT